MEEVRHLRRRAFGLALGLAAFAALAWGPTSLRDVPGFGARPALAAAVAVLMAVLWFTEAIPIGWTACLPLVLYPLLGVFGGGPAHGLVSAAAPYADAYIFLFMGGMAIGGAMEQWNLHRRIALEIMRRVGTDPKRLLLGMLVATAAVSLWISNTATAVMMVPIGIALVKQLELQRHDRLGGFGAALMLSVAYGSNIGGIGTKIGTPTNSLFAGFLSEKLGYELGFLQYMGIGMPFVALMIPITWLLLWQLAKSDPLGTAQGREVIEAELARLGPISRGERKVALVFSLAALLWVFGGPLRDLVAPPISHALGFKLLSKHYEAAVAMLAALTLISWRALSFAQLKRVPWSALLLLGGSFSLAAGIEGSGLAKWMTGELAGLRTLAPFTQVLLAAAASVVLSAMASNTATLNVMLNVLPSSLPVLTTSAIASSCDFALPAGTPPNAIVFGSGYVRLQTMMRAGALLDLIAILLLALYGWAYVPLLL